MKAQKKPVIIDYCPVPIGDSIYLMDFIEEMGDNPTDVLDLDVDGNFKVKTLEGISYDLTEDDVLIKGIKGEYYPCKKDIFEQSYDLI